MEPNYYCCHSGDLIYRLLDYAVSTKEANKSVVKLQQ